ncbi:MAG: RagB/SusD family nutrient uptake outer membrane protein [Gemmatimonadota bacterium]|nr:RagB/SusD family nutrient uptake outer membrane protein [Gemmatimonadota bacterium]
MNRHIKGWRGILGAAAFGVLLSGCDLFEVVNPGPIIDSALDEEAAGKTVLIGVAADVEVAVDAMAWLGGPASTDLDADATQPWLQDAGEGRLTVTNAESSWNPMQLARWGAGAGIARLTETQSDAATNQWLTAAYMWAGWANRILGDNVCIAVFGGEDTDGDGNADPGRVEASDMHYTRALERFETARSRAQGGGHDSIAVASTAGMAQANLILGNYSAAASLAAQIPDDFRWVAYRSDNSGREWNSVWQFTHENQKQITVWSMYNDSIGPDTDPRVPWRDMNQTSGGGVKPFYRQLKYTDRADDYPLAKGHEMRLIEAEAMLRMGDRQGAIDKINYVRERVGVPPVMASTDSEAWLVLDRERNFELWLEARRLKDNARFAAENLSPWAVAFMQGRHSCFPPSLAECSANPNVTGNSYCSQG